MGDVQVMSAGHPGSLAQPWTRDQWGRCHWTQPLSVAPSLPIDDISQNLRMMSKRDYERGIYLKGAFGRRDYMYSYEVAPWAYDKDNDWLKVSIKDSIALDVSDDWTRELGQVDIARILGAAPAEDNALPSQLTDGTDFYDSRDRTWNLGDSDVPDLKDRPARQLGYVYGHLDQVLRQKATTFDLLTYDDAVNDLLAAGLPTSLDTGALKIREQNPLSGFATSAKQDTMITALQIIDDMDFKKWSGTPLTGRDISSDLQTLTDNSIANTYRVRPMAKGITTITAGNAATNTTTNIYTVTAGKTFYLTYAMLSQAWTAASIALSSGYLLYQAGGAGGDLYLIWGAGSTSALIDRYGQIVPLTPSVPMPFTAGTIFKVQSNAVNLTAVATIMGWEE